MTLPEAAFDRAVRRLDAPDARGFVADLLEARGHRTTVEGMVVSAADGSGERTRLLVVDGLRSAAAGRRGESVDTVLVTGGPVARAAGDALARRTRTGPDRPTVRDTETLYEWFAYGVDDETRSVLSERYLDATEPTAIGRVRTALADGAGTAVRLGGLHPPSRRSAGVALVGLMALSALVVAAAAGPGGLLAPGEPPSGSADAPTPDQTPGPATASPAPEPTETGAPLPDACPPPPPGVHPAELRPPVRRTASANGLDGWRLLVTGNTSEYEFDPNDQRAGVVPELRHLAVFEAPGGATFRLGLDRWQSPARAGAAARDGLRGLGLPWGAYTVWVEWSPARATNEAAAANLLAAVRGPDGARLGTECVTTVATAPGTNAASALSGPGMDRR